MDESKTDRSADPRGSPEASQVLLDLLRTYAAKVDAAMAAEVNYHGVMVAGYMRHGGKLKRRAIKRGREAFVLLTEAVHNLQEVNWAVRQRGEEDGMPLEALLALDETFEFAEQEYAGYLAAMSDEDVLEVVSNRGPGRDRVTNGRGDHTEGLNGRS